MRKLTVIIMVFICVRANAQLCDCAREFDFIKHSVEQNFAGFSDRVKTISKKKYNKEVAKFTKLTTNKFASDNCPLIIYQYLDLFKSHHLGFYSKVDYTKIDTNYVNHRPLYTLSDNEIERVEKSTSWEGIYYFTHDSSVKVAVIKDPTPLHDYIGVIIESARPTWKRGMIKFEGKLVNDTLIKGLLYMRNHRPKIEGFALNDHNNMIGGDWRRVGSVKPSAKAIPFENESNAPIELKQISPNTVYFKIESFETDMSFMLDSVLKINEHLLNSSPNLILDLRDNGGGADALWEPLLQYIYTDPVKLIGSNILVTPANISGWKKYLQNKNISQETSNNIENVIAKMEGAKINSWITKNEDYIDSSMKPKLFPKKVIILINKWCGSSTEQFLLIAKQSGKVILAGEHSIGNLDYSNVVEMPFSCFPYTLQYATTRSRRLDTGQGIDNIGIAPRYNFSENSDWIKEAQNILGDPE